MVSFIQDVVGGLATGSIYALLVLGLTLIYQVSGIVNFAQSALATLGVYLIWTLTVNSGAPWVLAAVIMIVALFAVGVVLQAFLLGRLQQAQATAVIVTLGLLIVLEGIIGLIWGQTTPQTPLALPFTPSPLIIGSLFLSGLDLTAIGVTVILIVVLAVFLRFTRAGAALRAVAQSSQGARLVGIRVDRVRLIAWGIGAVFAGEAGILIATATFQQQSPSMVDVFLLSAFAGAIIGGLDNLVGAAVGALSIGVIRNLIALYAPTGVAVYKDGVVFLLLLVVLFVRPSGIFGTAVQRRV